ncbi:MAG: hypothetical protein ABSG68_27220 [Thermoguttaceae bacterium]
MQALLIAVFCVVGAEQPPYGVAGPQEEAIVDPSQAAPVPGPAAAGPENPMGQGPHGYQQGPPRDPQEGCDRHSFFGCIAAWFEPMPQTCYSPRYGCYPGNGRDIQRYPAFHGYYYRRGYNYRTLYEYPWYAQPHDPLAYLPRNRPDPGPAGHDELIPGGPEVVPTPPGESPHSGGRSWRLDADPGQSPSRATATDRSSPNRLPAEAETYRGAWPEAVRTF